MAGKDSRGRVGWANAERAAGASGLVCRPVSLPGRAGPSGHRAHPIKPPYGVAGLCPISAPRLRDSPAPRSVFGSCHVNWFRNQ